MTIRKILITGEEVFLDRHRLLFDALSTHFAELDCMAIGHLYEPQSFRRVMRLLYCLTTGTSLSNSDAYFKNAGAFVTRSRRIEKRIANLATKPDLVLHIFALCCPSWNESDIPYALYLDYSMALAAKNHPISAPFKGEQALRNWMDCERRAFDRAKYIFTMSNVVKSSLVDEYGISPDKITVVGSSGNRQEVYPCEKSFGSKQLLFNGSEFDRKGGSFVIETFRKLKQIIPSVKLVIIGKKIDIDEDSIDNPGKIESAAELENLFLTSDLVLAPAICDPFPTFVLEAMSYGIPCVVSNNDGMPEIVEHDHTGLVIFERNPALVAVDIANLLNNNQRMLTMSVHAKEKISTQFNWQIIAEKMSKIMLS
jgi:glycogen synthase